MKKHELNSLIIFGLLSGSLLAGKVHADTKAKNDSSSQTSKDNPSSDDVMTEDELLMQLDDEGTKIYQSLSPEGKRLALKVASQKCAGENECKGLNACNSDLNTCAGKAACKGKGKCSLSDPNLAVKLVQKKMAEKRINAQKK